MLYYHLFFYGQVLQNLIEMGFDEKDALEALRISRNNQNDAVSVLINHGCDVDLKQYESVFF